MCFLAGYPLVHYIAFTVDDLDRCSFKLFACSGIYLAHLHRSFIIGVGDSQLIFAIIFDSCCEFIGFIIAFCYIDNNFMCCCIINNTLYSIVNLCNRVLISTCLLKGNFSKDCLSILCCFCLVCLRHRSILGYRCQLKGKAVSFAPCIEGLGCFQCRFCCCVSICNYKIIIVVILNTCMELVILILCYSNNSFVLLCIIGYAFYTVIHFCNKVLISACSFIFYASEDSCLSIFGCCRGCDFLTSSIFRHWSVINRFKIKGKCICLTPIIERFGCL